MKNKKIKIFISVLIFIAVLILIILAYIWYTNCESICGIEVSDVTITETISSINVSEFKQELDAWDKILIDIRTQEELDTFGLIWEDALHLDIYKANFSTELDNLDKSKEYLIYCYHGNRTKSALDIMEQKWFEYVKDLNGGIDAWINNWEEVFK